MLFYFLDDLGKTLYVPCLARNEVGGYWCDDALRTANGHCVSHLSYIRLRPFVNYFMLDVCYDYPTY